MKRIFGNMLLIAVFLFGSGYTVNGKNKISDSHATRQTKNLFHNMTKLSKQGTMIGHQDALAYGVGWFEDGNRCDFRDASGRYPAVFGWDLGHIELDKNANLDSVKFDLMRHYVKRVYDMGGINTFSWHVQNPLTGESAWDVSSKDVVRNVLPGGTKHKLYLTWLDRVASFFLSLKSDDGELIPIIFRPYHELSGNWFWWCESQCSINEYIALWRMTVDYLRIEKGLHNIIWSYSMAGYVSSEEFLERYPGDKYVDMIGFDCYQRKSVDAQDQFTKIITSNIDILLQVAGVTGKLPAITEVGSEGICNKEWYTTVMLPLVRRGAISYMLLWRNAYTIPGHFYAAYPGHQSAENLRSFVENQVILTVDKISNIYSK